MTLPCTFVVATVGATGWPYEPREGSRISDRVPLGPLADVIEPPVLGLVTCWCEVLGADCGIPNAPVESDTDRGTSRAGLVGGGIFCWLAEVTG